MIVMEERPGLDICSGYEVELRVERTDISFHDLAGDKVRINVRVCNAGGQRSEPTEMRIESAPLGAFVPGTKLSCAWSERIFRFTIWPETRSGLTSGSATKY